MKCDEVEEEKEEEEKTREGVGNKFWRQSCRNNKALNWKVLWSCP